MTARQGHWRIMFCWQNFTLSYMMLWLRGMHWQTLWQLQNLCLAFSWAWLVRLCDRLPLVNSPQFVSDVCWYVHQAAAWLWGVKLQLKLLKFEDCLWVYQQTGTTGNWGIINPPANPVLSSCAHAHKDWIAYKNHVLLWRMSSEAANLLIRRMLTESDSCWFAGSDTTMQILTSKT